MRRIINAVAKMLQGISQAVVRFPLTVLCLLSSTTLICYLISLHRTPGLIIQKLMFTLLIGAFLGITAQFACERFSRLAAQRTGVYALSILLTAAYYLIIAPAPVIDFGVGARTSVAVFALFSAFIWLPSARGRSDFNSVALVHFKSALTAILYAGVLSAGLAALIAAIDLLLFNISNDAYGYMLAIVWMLFAAIYYLSRLPRFNSSDAQDRAETAEASQYPRILEILVSQIAIPLLAAYTLVLLSYFVKIGVTRKWPIGQLGPMIIGYSAAGLLIYVLASRLSSRSAVLYQRIFPKVLIPIVIVQLISAYIRLQAYGVTESRYYVALFGIFSLVVGIALSLRRVSRNGIIALLAAGFAIFSIIPPVDAFTVSRISQVNRLEQMLQSAGVLVNGQTSAKTNVDLTVRVETTNILNYLNQRGYLPQVTWLPAGFEPYRDMQGTLGFEPTYPYMNANPTGWSVNLNMQSPLPITSYDVMLQVSSYRKQPVTSYDFTVGSTAYRLVLNRTSAQEVIVSIQNAAGTTLVSTGLQEFVTKLTGTTMQPRMLEADQLSLDATGYGCKLRIVFQGVNGTVGSPDYDGIDYSMFVLIAVVP